jgi:pimeloyl-ACP methyl ester carboxylesterase
MKNINRLLGLVFALVSVLFAVSLFPNLGAAKVVKSTITVEGRPGTTVKAKVFIPTSPIAIAVLLMGGSGKIVVRSGPRGFPGFIADNAERFAEHGLLAVLVDAPSDHRGSEGMRPQFRFGDAHVADVDAIIDHVKQETNLSVWLIGVSLGSISAANVASNSRHRVGGLVLASSSVSSRMPWSVPNLELASVDAPALLVAHKKDRCRGTPPEGTKIIAEKLVNARLIEIRIFTGGQNEGRNPCHPGTPHTFHGIQAEVVRFIADFVKTHSR